MSSEVNLHKGKVVPGINKVSCHEDLGGSRGIAPRIPNLCSR